MRILLISTYELGRQPVHVASPAAALQVAGHEVSTVDMSVESLTVAEIGAADAVAISVPMHTAMRLAAETARQIREIRPDLPIAFYGLYAGIGVGDTLGTLADRLIAGEYEPALVDWVKEATTGMSTSIPRSNFQVPSRQSLPALREYARLEWEGEARLAGAVEASHGCRHRCRHCPIPVVYNGRWRPVGQDQVLGDIDNLVSAGARHITFGDPDFLNAPRYSLDILREAHHAHPDLSYDATVKVEHVLRYPHAIDEMSRLGVLFVVSAFESVDEPTLGLLAKDHTVADLSEAISVVRGSGMHIRPTWLPFFPWTKVSDLTAIVEFIDLHRLWEATDPVQLTIKLLLPEGSLLETHPEVTPYLTEYDPALLTWRWEFADSETGSLQGRLDSIASAASDCGEETVATLEAMRDAIAAAAGFGFAAMPSGQPAPRLTEGWFCCAEPTASQMVSISGPALQSR